MKLSFVELLSKVDEAAVDITSTTKQMPNSSLVVHKQVPKSSARLQKQAPKSSSVVLCHRSRSRRGCRASDEDLGSGAKASAEGLAKDAECAKDTAPLPMRLKCLTLEVQTTMAAATNGKARILFRTIARVAHPRG